MMNVYLFLRLDSRFGLLLDGVAAFRFRPPFLGDEAAGFLSSFSSSLAPTGSSSISDKCWVIIEWKNHLVVDTLAPWDVSRLTSLSDFCAAVAGSDVIMITFEVSTSFVARADKVSRNIPPAAATIRRSSCSGGAFFPATPLQK